MGEWHWTPAEHLRAGNQVGAAFGPLLEDGWVWTDAPEHTHLPPDRLYPVTVESVVLDQLDDNPTQVRLGLASAGGTVYWKIPAGTAVPVWDDPLAPDPPISVIAGSDHKPITVRSRADRG
ncbi:MAG: hypothetical protein GY795_24510 [Desulfobacterales bacterium]|nr:hypothetical protein [Desulfobacterales bacterium]